MEGVSQGSYSRVDNKRANLLDIPTKKPRLNPKEKSQTENAQRLKSGALKGGGWNASFAPALLEHIRGVRRKPATSKRTMVREKSKTTSINVNRVGGGEKKSKSSGCGNLFTKQQNQKKGGVAWKMKRKGETSRYVGGVSN